MDHPGPNGRGAPAALWVPRAWVDRASGGSTDMMERAWAVHRVADAVLAPRAGPVDEVDDCPQGKQVWIRPSRDGSWSFVTRRLSETDRFPTTHPLAGRPRYEWFDRGDGLRYGYPVEAVALGPPPVATPRLTVTLDWREILRQGLDTGLLTPPEYRAKYDAKSREEEASLGR